MLVICSACSCPSSHFREKTQASAFLGLRDASAQHAGLQVMTAVPLSVAETLWGLCPITHPGPLREEVCATRKITHGLSSHPPHLPGPVGRAPG